MRSLSFLVSGAAALFICASCGSNDANSVCGAERPCLPEGTWTVSYGMTSSGQTFTSNTIRIDENGVEVLGEEVPDDTCGPSAEPGNLVTKAQLSADGCTVLSVISKQWCESGEDNCEERRVSLDFCRRGSATTATGSLEACVCWENGSPFCSTDDDFVTAGAKATRAP